MATSSIGHLRAMSTASTIRLAGGMAVRGLAVILGLATSGCRSGVLDPRGPVGEAEYTILFNALAIMLAIVVPTILVALAFAWWFRASNTKANYRPDWAYSGQIELVVWSIPVLVIVFLGGITWIGSHQLDPAQPLASSAKPVEIEVVSLDWKWLFIYPDAGIATVNQLTIPAGTPVHFQLTAASVMNAFFVPQLGSMIYTMNGMTTQLYLQADREGDYYGRSTHFSGDGFPGMQFMVHAVSPDAFNGWIKAAGDGSPVLDRASYEALSVPSSDVAPATYRLGDPDLFHAIATQMIPPAPGPQSDRPSAPMAAKPGG